MKLFSPNRVQFRAAFRLFLCRIRSLAPSQERLDSSLRAPSLLSCKLTPRISGRHLAALGTCFVVATFWMVLLAKDGNHSRTVFQPSQSQELPDANSRPTTPTRDTSQSDQVQAQAQPYKPAPHYRMLTQKEERAIVKAAWAHDVADSELRDCSHTVQEIYAAAGFEYAYASSFDLYRGTGNFVRVTHPQSGDLIAWPGHVGIVLSPKRHSFYSLVSNGLQAQDYRGPYWRGRGHPRFYRYILERPAVSPRSGKDPVSTKAQDR